MDTRKRSVAANKIDYEPGRYAALTQAVRAMANLDPHTEIYFNPHENALPVYRDVIEKRSNSFYQAALLIAGQSESANQELAALKIFHEKRIKDKDNSDEKLEACLFAFVSEIEKIIAPLLREEIIPLPAIHLANAERIVNMKHRPVVCTISPISADEYCIQIDEPLNQWRFLSPEQQKMWANDFMHQKTTPSLFPQAEMRNKKEGILGELKMPLWERQYWRHQMAKPIDHPDKIFGPVVKKQGFCGLRNVYASSVGVVKFKPGQESVSTAFMSSKTIRSSNVIASVKDAVDHLGPGMEHLTDLNVRQAEYIGELLLNSAANNQRPKKQYLLYQTLLRPAGGGDDNVVKFKNQALGERHQPGNFTIRWSNHCIAVPLINESRTVAAVALDFSGISTSDLTHLTDPVKDFIAADDFLTKQYDLACAGKFKMEMISDEKLLPFAKVLGALSEYVIAGKNKDYNNNYQLHQAVLEEMIYQYTGNMVQSSCKSGKDREGVEKCYRNAVTAYVELYKKFPPLGANESDREKFIKIFVSLFKTNHQAILAEYNADGCRGLKALDSILPLDIYAHLKKNNPELLHAHEVNSDLNELKNPEKVLGKFPATKEDYAHYKDSSPKPDRMSRL
jgi:hypothetical protein